MVSFLDLGLLEHFSVLFPVMFVFLVVFALLERFNFPIGGEKGRGINALIALTLAGILLFSKNSLNIVSLLAPWFVIGIVFLLLLFLLFMMFGVKEDQFLKVVREDKLVNLSVVIISIILLMGAIAKTFFAATPDGSGGFGEAFVTGTAGSVGEAAFWLTLFHPKVLGVLFVLVIALFAVKLLSGNIVPR